VRNAIDLRHGIAQEDHPIIVFDATSDLASTPNRHNGARMPDLALLGPSCCRYTGASARY
jgi:hypothetical protein